MKAPATGTTATDAAIRIRGLRKVYGGLAAVDGIDLDIARGETFALLGPNGAGKTTAVEILEGYRHRTAGEVSVLGVDPAHGGWTGRRGSASCCNRRRSRASTPCASSSRTSRGSTRRRGTSTR